MSSGDLTSPFSPGLPVRPEFFSGRKDQIEELRRKVAESAAGRLQVAFVAGERGIGKSSLASFIKQLAEREQRALALHVFLGGTNTVTETTRRIFDRLLKESEQASWYERVKDFFGDRVRQVGLFGVSVEFKPSADDLKTLTDNFPQSLERLIQRLGDRRRCVLLILDDINGLANSRRFAEWLKSVVDEIATSGMRLPVCLILVGLQDRRDGLIALQPSLARVLTPIDIPAWSEAECREFFGKSFRSVDIRIDDEALDLLAFYCGGLPVLAHELGDVAFSYSEGGAIDARIAADSVTAAAQIVGRKYLRPRVFAAIYSQRYRSILRKLTGGELRLGFTRSEVRERLSREEWRVFDNFLRRFERLGAIEKYSDRGRGAYRFVNQLHAVYFWMVARGGNPAR